MSPDVLAWGISEYLFKFHFAVNILDYYWPGPAELKQLLFSP